MQGFVALLLGAVLAIAASTIGQWARDRGWVAFDLPLQLVGAIGCAAFLILALWLAWRADGSLTACWRFCD